MRIWIIMLLACAAWGWHRWEPDVEELEGAAPDAAAPVSAGPAVEPDPAWYRALPWHDPPVAEPPPEPVVHCDLAGDGEEGGAEETFVRRSECESRGGSIAVPAWAL